MIDLNSFLSEMSQPGDSVGTVDRRRVIDDAELAARLKYYEQNTPGFEATEEHLMAMKAIFQEHRNVLITGGAGVGKTTFVKSVIMPELDYRNLHWSVTATTGIAGSHLDGKTMHSFFGIGLGPDWPRTYPRKMTEYLENIRSGGPCPRPKDMEPDELRAWYQMFYDQWLNDPKTKAHVRHGVLSRLRSHEVVLLDEVSMLHGDGMMGYLEFMLQQIRGNDRPFGGLQMVFIGDFAQLPPVEEGEDSDNADWAFMCRTWDSARVKPIELTKVFRQGDSRFIEFLNNIRAGRLTPGDRLYAAGFVRNDMTVEETRFYTFLVPTNEQARRINLSALEQYPGPTIPLHAEFRVVPGIQRMKDWETRNVDAVKEELVKVLRRRLLDKTSFVRIGYPVMFTVNDTDGRFVNGTRGFLREVCINQRGPDDWSDTDYVVVGIPGKTADEPERLVQLTRWSYSRSREQDTKEQVQVHPSWNANPDNPKLPEFVSMFPSVRHFPLIPAVAITIHKSQGMSMDKAILALARTFAAGHVYVGLSRLRSPDGMILTEPNFDVKVDPLVKKYYHSIAEQHGT